MPLILSKILSLNKFQATSVLIVLCDDLSLSIDSALTFEPYISNVLNLPFISLKMWISCIFTLQTVTALEEVSCVNCSIRPQETLLSVEQTQLYHG